MINIREARVDDAEEFLRLLMQLDNETSFMLFEPGERKTSTDQVRQRIEDSIKESLLLFAEEEGKLVGYLSAGRGSANRIKHSAYIIVGILKDYGGVGIGKRLFQELDQWATAHGITRLELTVMVNNERAVALYQKMGFKIEGVKEMSCYINGEYVDEYYMGKVIRNSQT